MNTSPSLANAALRQVMQLAAAFAGGWLFSLLDAPAAWMSGAVVAVAVLCAIGRAVPVAHGLSDTAMLLAGVSMGTAATPEALASFGRYPASLALLGLYIVVVIAVSSGWLVRFCGWSKVDAVLGSAPGALSTVLAVAADRGTQVGSIAVVQSVRLAALIVVLPSVVFSLQGDGFNPPSPMVTLDAPTFAVLMFGGLAAGLFFARLGVAAPMLFGAAAVSTVLHGAGLAVGGFPKPLAIVAFVLLGTFTGARFRNVDRASLLASFPAALGSLVSSVAVASCFAFLAAKAAGVPLGAALVAFAPGGLEAMTVLALALGLNPIYVGAHHLARFIAIGFVLPIVVGRLAGPRAEVDET